MNNKKLIAGILPVVISIIILACGSVAKPTALLTQTPAALSYEQRIEAIMTRETGVINSLEKDETLRRSLLQSATLAFSTYIWETSITNGNTDVASASLTVIVDLCGELGTKEETALILQSMDFITKYPDEASMYAFDTSNDLKNQIYSDLFNNYENKAIPGVFDLTSLRLEIAFDLDAYTFQIKNNDSVDMPNALFKEDIDKLRTWSGYFFEPGIEEKEALINNVLDGKLTVERIEQLQVDFDYWFDEALQYVLLNN